MIRDILNEIYWFFEDHALMLLTVFGSILVLFVLVGGAMLAPSPTPTPMPTLTPTPIIYNGSNNTVVNASTPTPTPLPTYPTPQPNKYFEYEDYVLWVTNQFYNATLPNTNNSFINPLSYEAYLLWANQTAHPTPAPTIRPDDSQPFGDRIYTSPTPTPTPTPAPDDPWNREVHTKVIDTGFADLNLKASNNGYLSLANTRGVYDYYVQGDYALLQLEFMNTNPDTVNNPVVNLRFNKVDGYGHVIPWIYKEYKVNTTIQKATWNYDRTQCLAATKYAFFYEIGTIPNVIPDNNVLMNSRGTYQVILTIYNEDKTLVLSSISWQVNVL